MTPSEDTAYVDLTRPETLAELDDARAACTASLFNLARLIGFADLTETLHRPVCDFITAKTVGEIREKPHLTKYIHKWQEHWSSLPDQITIIRRLVLLPRDHFKSSIISLAYPLWRQVTDPNVSILQSSSKVDNSAHFCARQRRLYEHHPLFRLLFCLGDRSLLPDINKVKWTDAEYVINRSQDRVEATVTTTGVGGGIASRHYDLHIFDDLINETMIESPEELRRVKEWFEYAEHALVQPETSEMVGLATLWPCDPDISVYLMDQRPEFMVYKRSAIEDGKPIFPERYTIERLLAIQKRDPKKFACQFQNEPRGGGFTEFSESWLRYYDLDADGAIRREDGKTLHLDRLNLYHVVDPAMAEKPGVSSQNADVVTGMDEDEDVYLVEEWAAYCTPTDLIDKILAMNVRHNLYTVHIEAVAYQKALKYFLEAKAEQQKLDIRVEPIKLDTTKSKSARIRGLEPFVRAGKFWIRREHVIFREQFVNFPMTGKLNDVLDAVAHGPSIWQPPLSDAERNALDEEIEDAMAGRNTTTGY